MYIRRSPHDARDRRDQFNVIDTGSGWKIDLVIRKDRGEEIDDRYLERWAAALGVGSLLERARNG